MVMPYEDQLDVRRPVRCVARGHGRERVRWRELELEHEHGPELERGREHAHVLIAATGSCSLVVVVAVQLEVMLIPYVVDHRGWSSRVEGVGVHHVDAEADGVVGHNEGVRWHQPGGDKKDQAHIEPRQSVGWPEGWAAKHRQGGMAVYE